MTPKKRSSGKAQAELYKKRKKQQEKSAKNQAPKKTQRKKKNSKFKSKFLDMRFNFAFQKKNCGVKMYSLNQKIKERKKARNKCVFFLF